MNIFSLSEIVMHAKERSDFYKHLYQDVYDIELKNLPLVDQSLFWKMNSLTDNHLLTAPLEDAIVFKSGGTTGNPKFSVYTRNEWRAFTQIFGDGMARHAIEPGDRVANLFYAGDLYASFLFIHDSLERASKATVNFPIAGHIQADHLADLIKEFSIQVLAGVPTTIISFAQHFSDQKITIPEVKKILFGGESLYADQREFLKTIFPSAKILSIGYASVDGGLLGYADGSCKPDEHRCFGESTIVEIIDDYGMPILEMNKIGQLHVTSLTRKLMPIIRYPAGDLAQWTEPVHAKDRRFKIVGRSELGARVGPATIYYDDVYMIIENLRKEFGLRGLQLVTRREDHKDTLILRMMGVDEVEKQKQISPVLIEQLLSQRPMLKELVDDQKIGRPYVEWVNSNQMEVNSRTGKLKRVIDLRQGSK